MNRHFRDARYYLKRAVTTAKKGVIEELAPLEARVRTLLGKEEPETGRFDEMKADARDLKDRAESEAKTAVAEACERVEARRKTEA